MMKFRLWRVLVLASALVTPLPIAEVVQHHTSVVVQHDRTTIEMQPELASSTWTRRDVKARGL